MGAGISDLRLFVQVVENGNGTSSAERLVEDIAGIAAIPETAALRCKQSRDLRVANLAGG